MACSGGQDSMCLVQLLRDLCNQWQWSLAIAHCDHRWPVDSGENEKFVRQQVQGWNLPYFNDCAPEELRTEAGGRDWRYQTLTMIAQAEGYEFVVTGHTASDRAETLLYNLFRGSGMAGIAALGWQRSLSAQVQLVRPLLEVTREQTGQFCRDLGLTVWEDRMNRDRHYRRNRLRLDILPELRSQFNPNLDQTLAHTAELLTAEEEFMADQAREWLVKGLELEKSGQTRLSRTVLKSIPIALQRRVIRQWVLESRGFGLNFLQTEKIRALVMAGNGDRTDPFSGGWGVEVVEGGLCFYRPSDLS